MENFGKLRKGAWTGQEAAIEEDGGVWPARVDACSCFLVWIVKARKQT